MSGAKAVFLNLNLHLNFTLNLNLKDWFVVNY